MKQDSVILHVGLMRCASTFLQKKVFPLSPHKVISHELFSGNASYPKRLGFDFRNMMVVGLRAYYGDVPVIVCVRNPVKWVNSLYNQYVKHGQFHSYRFWMDNIFDERLLKFDEYIDLLKQNFSNVFVFDLETFDLESLCDFLDVDYTKVDNVRVNRSLSPVLLEVIRLVNMFREFCFKMVKEG